MAKKNRVVQALHCSQCNRFNYVEHVPSNKNKFTWSDGKMKMCPQCIQEGSEIPGMHTMHVYKRIAKPN